MNIEANITKMALLGLNSSVDNLDIFPTIVKQCIDTNQASYKQFLDGLSIYSAYIEAGEELHKIDNISKKPLIAPNEDKAYCTQEMLMLLDMIIEQKEYSFISFLPNFIKILKSKNQILPSKYYKELTKYDKESIEIFGKLGKWIYSLIDTQQTTTDLLSMKKAQRTKHFLHLLDSGDEKNTILFLQTLFEAITPSERVGYINELINRQIYISSYIEFLDDFIQNNPKKSKNLYPLLVKLKLLDTNSKLFEEYFENIFCKIWQKQNDKYLLIEPQDLTQLLSKLEFFTTLDETLEFVLYITPISKWLDMMQIDYIQFLTEFKYAKNRYKKEEILQCWLNQAILKKDKVLLYSLIDIDIHIADTKLLKIFDNNEIFTFLKKYFYIFSKNKISLIDIVTQHPIMQQSWSSNFSITYLKGFFATERYPYNAKRWSKAIYTIAPYLHPDAMLWLEQKLKDIDRNSPLLDLKENFEQLHKLKNMYEIIKIQEG